jgi:hypothetical protein
MLGARIKRGFVYTVIIFVLGITIVSLMTLGAESRQHLIKAHFPQTDEQILAFRLEEVSQLTKHTLGLDIKNSRNATHSNLTISDNAFPMNNYSLYGYAHLSSLNSKLEGAWEDSTNSQITYNYSNLNDSGWLIGMSDGMSYYHDNSNTAYDQTILNIPNSTNITNLNISIYCKPPINTEIRPFDDWTASGSTGSATIIYDDGLSSPHSNSINFDFNSNQSFNATYYDGTGGNWTQTIHIDFKRLDPENKVLIYSSTNSSYNPPITKINVSCNFNLTIQTNLSMNEEYRLFFPVTTTLEYGEANYTNNYLYYIKN